MGRFAARAAVFAALIVLTAAGCGSSGSSSSSRAARARRRRPRPAGPPLPRPPRCRRSRPSSSRSTRAIRRRPRPSPADCGSQPSTLAIEQCYEANTENTDAQIDTVQQGLYNSASSSAKSTILAQDSAWLAARGPVCKAAFNTGGTIDEISIAACLLDESTARLDAVKNIVPPEAKLKSTDSTDPNDLSWYTTPEGSRMAEIDTQGDQTGGAVISWVIIGGAQGFVINPKQFFFQDGSFTDPGIIQGTNPTYHKVPTGVMYQFGIDYSTLSSDPNAAKGSGGYVYVPGTPVAVWQ